MDDEPGVTGGRTMDEIDPQAEPNEASVRRLMRAANRVAEDVAMNVLHEMDRVYPGPMRHASGGFRTTLRHSIVRRVKAAIMEDDDLTAG